MTALDLAASARARESLRGDPMGEVLADFLVVAEGYVKSGIRWGLIEDTAAKIVAAHENSEAHE